MDRWTFYLAQVVVVAAPFSKESLPNHHYFIILRRLEEKMIRLLLVKLVFIEYFIIKFNY